MNYLVDTCVISEYLKKQPERRVIDWLDEQDERKLYLSSLTIAELKKGYFKLINKGAVQNSTNKNRKNKSSQNKAAKIRLWIQQLEQRFESRLIGVDAEILTEWSQLCGQAESAGNKLPVIDSLLAATARAHGMVMVTRNVEDFERCNRDIEMLNPF